MVKQRAPKKSQSLRERMLAEHGKTVQNLQIEVQTWRRKHAVAVGECAAWKARFDQLLRFLAGSRNEPSEGSGSSTWTMS